MAADKRLFEESGGKGSKCNCCQMAMLCIDKSCPFCGSNDKSDYEVTATYLKQAIYRYRCGSRPRDSIENAPKISRVKL